MIWTRSRMLQMSSKFAPVGAPFRAAPVRVVAWQRVQKPFMKPCPKLAGDPPVKRSAVPPAGQVVPVAVSGAGVASGQDGCRFVDGSSMGAALPHASDVTAAARRTARSGRVELIRLSGTGCFV